MSSSSWGLARRVGFRFGFLYVALYALPFPVTLLPWTDWLGDLWNEPFAWGVSAFAEHVLGLARPGMEFNGSGDRTYDYVQLLLYALLAALGAIVWSALALRRHRPTSHSRLASWLWIFLRYFLGYLMLTYGAAKVLKSQFPDLTPGRLFEPIGEMSPMGLLWTFMGYSLPYTVFSGVLESIGGLLLLWRRTTTIGALLVAVVMSNVVMLNFCYDVPVKLFSIHLLIIALAIAGPRLRPLLAAALGRATAEEPPRVRMSLRWERARWIAKLVFFAAAAWSLYKAFDRPSRNAHVHDLYGGWIVDSFALEGVERPPRPDDPERWQKLGLNPRGAWIFPMTGDREGLALKVDADKRTLTIDLDDQVKDNFGRKGPDGKTVQEVWTYSRPVPDRLVIDAVHRGKKIHATLHLAPPGLLMTRGFRWINETPFNR